MGAYLHYFYSTVTKRDQQWFQENNGVNEWCDGAECVVVKAKNTKQTISALITSSIARGS